MKYQSENKIPEMEHLKQTFAIQKEETSTQGNWNFRKLSENK